MRWRDTYCESAYHSQHMATVLFDSYMTRLLTLASYESRATRPDTDSKLELNFLGLRTLQPLGMLSSNDWGAFFGVKLAQRVVSYWPPFSTEAGSWRPNVRWISCTRIFFKKYAVPKRCECLYVVKTLNSFFLTITHSCTAANRKNFKLLCNSKAWDWLFVICGICEYVKFEIILSGKKCIWILFKYVSCDNFVLFWNE
jgi:hypothetical protein